MDTLHNWPAGYKTRLVTVIQGEFHVSGDPDIAFSTVLGSCASVCLYDENAKIGGMNHYLLATGTTTNVKYGAHAMEILINQLLKKGASRNTLKAKVFGGSLMTGRFDYIGPSNTSFALGYLADESIEVVAQDIGGKGARRVNFHPITGKARVVNSAPLDETNVVAKVLEQPEQKSGGGLTLF